MLFWQFYFCNFIVMIALQDEKKNNTFSSAIEQQHLVTGKT